MKGEELKNKILFYCRNDCIIEEIENLKIKEIVKLIKKIEYKNVGKKILFSKLENDEKYINLYYELNKIIIKENKKKWNREYYRNMNKERKEKYINDIKKNIKNKKLENKEDKEDKEKKYIDKLINKIGIE